MVETFIGFMRASEDLLKNYGMQTEDLDSMYKQVKDCIVNERRVAFTLSAAESTEDADVNDFKSLISLPITSADEHSISITG